MYAGLESSDEYRDFSAISDLESTRDNLFHIKALDKLLAQIFEIYGEEDTEFVSKDLTVDSLFITLWARKIMGIEPPLEPMLLEDIRKFFILLREKENSFPYRLERFGARFISDFSEIDTHMSPEEKGHLVRALTFIWGRFKEEYQWVPIDNLDIKHLIFFKIKSV